MAGLIDVVVLLLAFFVTSGEFFHLLFNIEKVSGQRRDRITFSF